MENASEHLIPELSSTNESQREVREDIALGMHQNFRAKIRVIHYQKIFLGREDKKDMYLDDNMLEMLILWMGRHIKWNDKTEVHFMKSLFFTSLKDGGVLKALSWDRQVDIFKKSLVFIPICQGLHWTLCVLVNPGSVNKKDGKISSMLYFDPMGLAIPQGTRALIHNWLNERWKQQNKTKN